MTIGLLPNQSAPEETVNRLILGRLTLTLSGDVTLDDVQASYRFLDFQGTPGAALAVTVPNTPKEWIIRNTSGQTVTVKTSAGTGVAVDDGNNAHVYTDGVEVYALAQAGTPVAPSAIQAYKLVADLLGFDHHWRLDESTGTIAVDSAGSADGTITGGVTLAAEDSPIHLSGLKAMTLDGTSGYLDLGGALNTALSAIGTGDFSASFWIKTTATSGHPLYWGPTTGTDFDRIVIDLRAAGVARVFTRNQGGANELAEGVTAINDDAWHHIVAVRVSGTLRLYADAVEDIFAASAANLDTIAGHVLRIGVSALDSGFLAASLADYGLKTTGGLTAAQIRALCEAGNSYSAALSISKSPALYLRLNETAGTAATDYSFNGTDGTYAGGVTLGVADSPITNETPVFSASFDGVDDEITTPYAGVLGTNAFTVRGWVKIAQSGALIFGGWGTDSPGNRVEVAQGSSNQLVAGFNGAFLAGTTLINDSTWHQFAVVVPANATVADVVLYVDGVVETISNTSNGTQAINITSGQTVVIGRNVIGTGFGQLQMVEFAIDAAALSATDILELYQAPTFA